MPIVEFNVIGEITRNSVSGTPVGAEESVVDMLNSSLLKIKRKKVKALVWLIKTKHLTTQSAVKSRKQDTVIPQGQSVVISCRATVGPIGKIPVLFEFDADPSALVLKFRRHNLRLLDVQLVESTSELKSNKA